MSQEEKDYMSSIPYLSAVGSLMYLAIGTHPDIAFAVGLLSRFNSCPDKVHSNAIQHVFKYLKATVDLGLEFGPLASGGVVSLSGHVQDWECTQCPGTCRALTYLQGVTQGEQVPAECLSRSVIIMYKSKYIHGGLYLSRSEKKAAFSSYSSPALYNRQVTQRKDLSKRAVTHY